jgi:hypothetical protein
MRWIPLYLGMILSAKGASRSVDLLAEFASSLPMVHRTVDFDPAGKHPEWSPRRYSRSPAGEHKLLGPFKTDEEAELRLENLPPHDCLLIRVEVAILCHWDGVWKSYGPDVWRASLDGDTRLLETTFSNFSGALQNFPDEVGPVKHESRTGSSSHGELGWTLTMGERGEVWKDLDTTYTIWMAVQHHRPTVSFDFSGTFHDEPDPEELRGECWALRSCEVRVMPRRSSPSAHMVRVAAAEAFTAGTVPDSASTALLVMAGTKGFPVIEAILEEKGQLGLSRQALLEARNYATAETDGLIEKLSSADPTLQQEALSQMGESSPRLLAAIEKARDDAEDPAIWERLDEVLKKPRPPLVEIPDDAVVEPSVIAAGRLSHALRLIRDSQASRWLGLLKATAMGDAP